MSMTPEKLERIAARLQQRIAQITAQFELDVALLQDRIDELETALKEKDEAVQEEG